MWAEAVQQRRPSRVPGSSDGRDPFVIAGRRRRRGLRAETDAGGLAATKACLIQGRPNLESRSFVGYHRPTLVEQLAQKPVTQSPSPCRRQTASDSNGGNDTVAEGDHHGTASWRCLSGVGSQSRGASQAARRAAGLPYFFICCSWLRLRTRLEELGIGCCCDENRPWEVNGAHSID